MLKQKYACKKKYHLIVELGSSYCVLCYALNVVPSQEIVILIHITSYFVQLRRELNVLVFVQSFEEIQNSQYVKKTQSLLLVAHIIWGKTCHQSSAS
jgi:hypothetical protein